MREINQAWEVLRSPARRADYDAQLRGVTPVWEQSRVRAKRTAPVAPGVADLEPDRPGVEPPRSSGWRIGPIAVVVVVVAAMLAFAAWATTAGDEEPDVEVEAGTPLQEGDCVLLTSVDGRITPVRGACSSVGAMRVAAIVDLGRPCPDGSEAVDQPSAELRLCLGAPS
jgi:hypothetical protein